MYFIFLFCFESSFGYWGLGIGLWELGIGDWAQSPIPNPQSPIPNPQSPKLFSKLYKNIIYLIIHYILISYI